MTTKGTRFDYTGILKNTALMGGSAFLEIVIGMVRVKFVAILLGPSGVGVLGVFNSIVSMLTTVSGMGIPTAGVQQLVKAIKTGDGSKVAVTVAALRRFCLVTGAVTALLTMCASAYISEASFGTSDYTLGVALLGALVFITMIKAGQSCVIRANRRILDMAQVNVLGTLCGTAICIPCFYVWGVHGIAPSLVLAAAVSGIISYRYFVRIPAESIHLGSRDYRSEVRQLLHLGLPLMLSALLQAFVPYLAKVFLVRQVGLVGVGLYQAAFNLSGVLVSFVLAAMGADYYPRLTLVAHDSSKIRQEVNTQTEIALLLGVPGLAATIVFAPLVIAIFYSSDFTAAVDIMRWSIYGIFFQLLSWPIGFVILAKGKGKTFFFMELISNSCYLLLLLACTRLWGLKGTGIAFALLYLLNTVFRLILFRYLTAGHWSRSNLAHITLYLLVLTLLGLNCSLTTNTYLQWTVSIFLLSVVTFYCLKKLMVETGFSLGSLNSKLRR